MYRLHFFLVVVAVATFCAFIGWCFVGMGRSAYVESKCLELGYVESRVAWDYAGYCVKRDYRGEMYSIPLGTALGKR